MAAETEIDRLVVRLVGEGSEYTKMLKTAEKQTAETAAQVEKNSGKVEAFGKTLEHVGEKVVQGLAAEKIKHWLGEALGEFDTMERTAIAMEATLGANGRQVDKTMKSYQQWAAEMQELTTTGDDTTIALLNQAETFNLTGNAAKKAVKDAMSLAAINGSSADAMIRLTAAMAKGDTEQAMMFARMVPQLRGVKDEQEFLARYQKIVGAGWETQTKIAKTATGQIEQLKNQYGDLLEEIGAVVADGLKPVIKYTKEIITWFQGMSTETKTLVTRSAMLVAALLAVGPVVSITKLLFGNFTMIKTVLTVINGLLLKSPWGIILGAAAAVITMVITRMGGLEAAWAAVQAAGEHFWTFIEPIWNAFGDLVDTVIGRSTELISGMWDIAEFAFGRIAAVGEQLWHDFGEDVNQAAKWIRDTFVKAIVFAEFTLKNFGQVAEFVWVSTKYGFIKFVNEVEHFFTQTLPTVLKWLTTNWREAFNTIYSFTTTVFKNIAENVITFFDKVAKKLANPFENVNFREGWKGLTDGFVNSMPPLKIPERVIGQLEKDLKAEFEAKGEALGGDFNKFLAEKLAKWADNPEVKKAQEKANELGENIGEGIGEGLKDSKKVSEGALKGTGEALARMLDYQDKILGDRKPGDWKTQANNKVDAIKRIGIGGAGIGFRNEVPFNDNGDIERMMAGNAASQEGWDKKMEEFNRRREAARAEKDRIANDEAMRSAARDKEEQDYKDWRRNRPIEERLQGLQSRNMTDKEMKANNQLLGQIRDILSSDTQPDITFAPVNSTGSGR